MLLDGPGLGSSSVDDGESSNRDGGSQGERPGCAQRRAAVEHDPVLEPAHDCEESIAEHQDRHIHVQAQLADALWACDDRSVLHYELAWSDFSFQHARNNTIS